MTALDLATIFHEIYERRAPEFGYETRTETRKFDPSTANGQLMVAVCGEIITTLDGFEFVDSSLELKRE